MRRLTVFVLLIGLASPARAQEKPAPQPPADEQIDPTKLGVSLKKIQKGLFIAEAREKSKQDGLHLEFNVQVYGTAPKIDVLQGVDLFYGAVPGTAPSHNQMIEYWTPPIYRSPTMPVSALAFWAAKELFKKSAKSKCEEEIRAYRELVMQGVNVAAPRCTQ
jgi:hypothetical protein